MLKTLNTPAFLTNVRRVLKHLVPCFFCHLKRKAGGGVVDCLVALLSNQSKGKRLKWWRIEKYEKAFVLTTF
jgi:hypothetical protein